MLVFAFVVWDLGWWKQKFITDGCVKEQMNNTRDLKRVEVITFLLQKMIRTFDP